LLKLNPHTDNPDDPEAKAMLPKLHQMKKALKETNEKLKTLKGTDACCE
jgi:hypothetical protein